MTTLNEHARRWGLDAPSAILLAAIVLGRAGWMLHRPLSESGYEAENAAVSFAKHGVIGNVFANDGTLSAHLSPVMPIMTGTVYRAFGVQSGTSEALLAGLGIGFVFTSALLFNAAFARLHVKPLGRWLALAGILFPMFWEDETISFRWWEGGLAVAMSAMVLVVLIQADGRNADGKIFILLTSALLALLMLVSPPLGLAGYLCLATVLVRRRSLRDVIVYSSCAALTLAAVLTPWTIRNYQAFGQFIPLRSNLGLELAGAYFPGAAAAGKTEKGEADGLYARAMQIHPSNPAGYIEMRKAGGEVPYAKALGKEAKGWIISHPTESVVLAARHLREFYFPSMRQFIGLYHTFGALVPFKAYLFWLASGLAFLLCFRSLVIGRKDYLMPAIFLLVPSMPYLLVNPIPRYSYIVYFPMVFLAGALAAEIISSTTKIIGGSRFVGWGLRASPPSMP